MDMSGLWRGSTRPYFHPLLIICQLFPTLSSGGSSNTITKAATRRQYHDDNSNAISIAFNNSTNLAANKVLDHTECVARFWCMRN